METLLKLLVEAAADYYVAEATCWKQLKSPQEQTSLQECVQALEKLSVNTTKLKAKKHNARKLRDELRKLLEKELRPSWKTKIIEEAKKLTSNQDKCYHAREWLDDVVRGLLSAGDSILVVDAVLESKGLVGASSGPLYAVLEVGVSWDYLRDLPYIPASSIKGATRVVALLKCLTGGGSKEELMACIEAVAELLGNASGEEVKLVREALEEAGLGEAKIKEVVKKLEEARVGLLHFYDAYPVECGRNLLEPYVITPHYPDKVDEYSASPSPIPHLVLAPGNVFRFIVSYSGEAVKSLDKLVKGKKPQAAIAALLVSSLQTGVGARTSLGFSIFKPKLIRILQPEKA